MLCAIKLSSVNILFLLSAFFLEETVNAKIRASHRHKGQNEVN